MQSPHVRWMASIQREMLFGVNNNVADHGFRRTDFEMTGIVRDVLFRLAAALIYPGSITANCYGKSAK
jgi:hypothetical protein